MTHDPARYSPQDAELRSAFRRMEASRQARFDQLEERLAAHGKRVEAVLKAEREQAAAPVVTEPAEPAPVHTATSLPPGPANDLDLLAAESAIGSPAHLAWRKARIPNQSNGIL